MLKDSAIWCRFSFRSSIFKQIVTMGSWDQTYSSSRIFVCFLQVHWARANVRSECHHCEWSIAPHWVWSGWGSWRASDMHEASLTVIAVRKGGWTVDFSGYGAKAVLPPGDSLFFPAAWAPPTSYEAKDLWAYATNERYNWKTRGQVWFLASVHGFAKAVNGCPVLTFRVHETNY